MPVKKIKTEDVVDGADKEYKEQNKQMYKYRDKLAQVDFGDLKYLLEYNDQEIPTGKDNVSIFFYVWENRYNFISTEGKH